MRVVGALGLLGVCVAFGGDPWPVDLWLDRGGFWTNRLSVVAENLTSVPLEGFGVAVPLPDAIGREDLRVTDECGVQLAFTRRASDVVLPVTSAAQGRSRYFIYWGNPLAMAPAYCDWPLGTNAAETVRMSIGAVESLTVETLGGTSDWPPENWRYRVPVRLANFSDRPMKKTLFRFRLAEATHETPHPEWQLRFKGNVHAAELNGSDLVFRHSLRAKSIAVLYLYVREGHPLERMRIGEEETTDALLPNDTGIDDVPKFPPKTVVRFAHVGAIEHPPTAGVPSLAIAPADLSVLVFPDRPVVDVRGVYGVKLARNEHETLQIAVRSPVDCDDFSCDPTPPTNAAGETLAVEPGWTACVFVDAPSAFYVHDTKPWMLMYPHTRHPTSDGWSGWWPDPILPGSRTSLKANATKAFRLLVKTTTCTAPGDYQGTLIWRERGREVRRDPYTVRVWNFSLPSARDFAATFDVRGLSSQQDREKVYARLADYGLEADQSCRTLQFSRNAQGKIVCDFDTFDRLTEEFFVKWGFTDAYFPRNPFSLFGWGRKPADFLGEKAYEVGETDRSRLRPNYKAAYQEALRLFWNHLKAKGWEKRFALFVSDEPYLQRPEIVAQFKAVCDMIHEVDPAIQIYASTWRWSEALESCLDIWGISASGRFPVEKVPGLKAKGRRFWFTTDAQFPLDTPYMASELLFPVIAYFLGVEKYECWNCINFPQGDVWRYGFDRFKPRFGIPGKKDRWVRVPVGDGVLLYPPCETSNGAYVPTLRIDAIRDGLETYEYLKLLAREASPEAAALLAQFRKLATVPNAGGRYSKTMLPDPFRFGSLRAAAGELLDHRPSQP